MGRRPDPPGLQAEKGNPGKRKTAAEKRAENARALADRLASAPVEGSGVLAPPIMLEESTFAAPLAIWRRYAPELGKLNLLHRLDRDLFALFCVYVSEFYASAEIAADPAKKFRLVKTTSGDQMWREHPAVARMDEARKAMLELAKRFGLTALDRIELLSKQQATIPPSDPAGQGALDLADRAEDDPIGLMISTDSPPPGYRN